MKADRFADTAIQIWRLLGRLRLHKATGNKRAQRWIRTRILNLAGALTR
jgi:hypothetical protein